MQTHQESSQRRRERGFTLVEIMVVVVIIGLLATLVAPAVLGRNLEAQIEKAKSDISTIYSTAESFMISNRNQVPTMEELLEKDSNGQPYLRASNVEDGQVMDPWGNPYELQPGEGLNFYVISYGPDGEQDTEDDIRYPKDDD